MSEAELHEKLGALGRILALELVDTSDTRVFETGLKHFRHAGLEPIMKVEVVTPEDYLGDVIGDLNSRRGQIQGTNTRCNAQAVEAHVPLANMFGYADKLRSLSKGRAKCVVQFSHFGGASDNGGPPDSEPKIAALRA